MRPATARRLSAVVYLAGAAALAALFRPVGAAPRGAPAGALEGVAVEARGAPSPQAAGPGSCVVRAVHDGDTFTCADGRRVRLIGIDAPELDQQPFGPLAQRALATLLPIGQTVRLQTDVTPADRYGRLLAYVWTAQGVAVNLRLAEAGYVLPLTIPPNVAQAEAIAAAAAAARRDHRGLWATSAFACPPGDHRRRRC